MYSAPNGDLEHSNSGTGWFHEHSAEREIQVQNEANVPFCLSKSTHEAEKNKTENLRPSSLRFPVCPGWSLLLNSISVMCEECFPSKPDQNWDKIDFPNYFDLQFSMSRMHTY